MQQGRECYPESVDLCAVEFVRSSHHYHVDAKDWMCKSLNYYEQPHGQSLKLVDQ